MKQEYGINSKVEKLLIEFFGVNLPPRILLRERVL